VLQSFARDGGKVGLSLDTEPIAVDATMAVSLGLIATELIMNALKYAFPGGSPGKLKLGLHHAGEGAELLVEDSGIGMSNAAELPGGFGVHLVRSLASQLRGEATVESRPGHTAWTVRFPLA
jgi:two-component sensor histidine kinase